MVRDPVERFISEFYYQRKKFRSKCHTHKISQEWCSKDISACITSGDPECQFNPESSRPQEHQLSYFCGSSPECMRTGSTVALQKGIFFKLDLINTEDYKYIGFPFINGVQNTFLCHIAKFNAEMYYAVIGLQEDIQTSLCVMEAYVPLFFKGALKVYYETQSRQQRKQSLKKKAKKSKILVKHIGFAANVTPHKKTISDKARRILATNMTLEYEFYGFVKHRLKMQLESLRNQK